MAYGRKARSVRAYEYGCLPPIEGREVAIQQMDRRVELWNQLVELDRDFAVDLAVAVAACCEPAESNDKDARKAQWKAARKAAREREDELEGDAYRAARYLCTSAGLYWTNYDDVLTGWQLARKSVWHPTLKQLLARQGSAVLQYHRRAEHRKLALRWQNGLPVEMAFGQGTMLRIAPVDADALRSPIRGERRRAARTVVQFRGCSENRKPVWITLPMILHRPLPENGLIRSASLQCGRVGKHERWTLVLVVEAPEATEQEDRVLSGRPQCAVHLGWKKVDGGVCVATWVDSAGGRGQLVVPAAYLDGMRRVEECRSERDLQFNEARTRLARWLDAEPTVPEWLKVMTAHMPLWKSQGKLRRVVREWRQHPEDGDEVMRADLETWDRHERRQYEEEANLRERLLGYRREQYRLFAARLATRYSVVKLEDMDLAKLASRDGAGRLPKPVRHQRTLAGLSILRQAINNACQRERVGVEVVDGSYIARTCAECGRLTIRRVGESEAVFCDWCHALADREVNSAAVLLAKPPRQETRGRFARAQSVVGVDDQMVAAL